MRVKTERGTLDFYSFRDTADEAYEVKKRALLFARLARAEKKRAEALRVLCYCERTTITLEQDLTEYYLCGKELSRNGKTQY